MSLFESSLLQCMVIEGLQLKAFVSRSSYGFVYERDANFNPDFRRRPILGSFVLLIISSGYGYSLKSCFKFTVIELG